LRERERERDTTTRIGNGARATRNDYGARVSWGMQAWADDAVLQWSGRHSPKLSLSSLYTLFDLLVTKFLGFFFFFFFNWANSKLLLLFGIYFVVVVFI
jgi:hypothetical protein